MLLVASSQLVIHRINGVRCAVESLAKKSSSTSEMQRIAAIFKILKYFLGFSISSSIMQHFHEVASIFSVLKEQLHCICAPKHIFLLYKYAKISEI